MIRITAIGRAVTDGELKEINGTQCLNFRMAADTDVKKPEGGYESQFYSVSVWGKLGEAIAGFLKKGQQVYIRGVPRCRTYDHNGETRVDQSIRVSEIRCLGSKEKQQADNDGLPF